MPCQRLASAPFPVGRFIGLLAALRTVAEIVVVLVGVGFVFQIPCLPGRIEQCQLLFRAKRRRRRTERIRASATRKARLSAALRAARSREGCVRRAARHVRHTSVLPAPGFPRVRIEARVPHELHAFTRRSPKWHGRCRRPYSSTRCRGVERAVGSPGEYRATPYGDRRGRETPPF